MGQDQRHVISIKRRDRDDEGFCSSNPLGPARVGRLRQAATLACWGAALTAIRRTIRTHGGRPLHIRHQRMRNFHPRRRMIGTMVPAKRISQSRGPVLKSARVGSYAVDTSTAGPIPLYEVGWPTARSALSVPRLPRPRRAEAGATTGLMFAIGQPRQTASRSSWDGSGCQLRI